VIDDCMFRASITELSSSAWIEVIQLGGSADANNFLSLVRITNLTAVAAGGASTLFAFSSAQSLTVVVDSSYLQIVSANNIASIVRGFGYHMPHFYFSRTTMSIIAPGACAVLSTIVYSIHEAKTFRLTGVNVSLQCGSVSLFSYESGSQVNRTSIELVNSTFRIAASRVVPSGKVYLLAVAVGAKVSQLALSATDTVFQASRYTCTWSPCQRAP
jgi:hypothetical protein